MLGLDWFRRSWRTGSPGCKWLECYDRGHVRGGSAHPSVKPAPENWGSLGAAPE